MVDHYNGRRKQKRNKKSIQRQSIIKNKPFAVLFDMKIMIFSFVCEFLFFSCAIAMLTVHIGETTRHNSLNGNGKAVWILTMVQLVTGYTELRWLYGVCELMIN